MYVWRLICYLLCALEILSAGQTYFWLRADLAHQHEIFVLGVDCLLTIGCRPSLLLARWLAYVVDRCSPLPILEPLPSFSQGELALTIMGIDGEISPDVKAKLSSLSV